MISKTSTDSTRLRRWLIRFPRAIPIAIFAAIGLITVLSVYAIETAERDAQQAQLNKEAQAIAALLDRRANAYAAYLRSVAAFVASRGEPSLREFDQFVSELRLDNDFKSAEGIGWAPASEDVLPGQALNAPVRVAFLSPQTPHNSKAVGFDLTSDPARREAMLLSQQLVRPAASGKVALLGEDAENSAGFVIFMPVFDPGQSDLPLSGFVYSPFSAQQFLLQSIEEPMEQTNQITQNLRLYDGSPRAENLLGEYTGEGRGGVRSSQNVRIANRDFTLLVEQHEHTGFAFLSMVTMLFGLALGSLLMLLARLLTRQTVDDQARLEFYEEQHSIRNALSRELNHRVKNTLANVLSILSLTRRRATDLDQFADSFEGRVRSLSATHDLLTNSEWDTTQIRSVIEAELGHFRTAGEHRIELEGPPIALAPNDALSFGLAIHELATNAAKYGALSVSGGKLSIRWTRIDDDVAEIEWLERDGPPVSSDRRRGFGTELIEKIVAHELRHPIKLDFESDGVRCVIRIKVRQLQQFRMRAQETDNGYND